MRIRDETAQETDPLRRSHKSTGQGSEGAGLDSAEVAAVVASVDAERVAYRVFALPKAT